MGTSIYLTNYLSMMPDIAIKLYKLCYVGFTPPRKRKVLIGLALKAKSSHVNRIQ
ncbi:MAG: hypothetical protein WED04_12880 [Promethearchaeati archaeon SRVP18_Atabeyarchaeia-1]